MRFVFGDVEDLSRQVPGLGFLDGALLALVRLNLADKVDIEPGVNPPAQHVGPVYRPQALVHNRKQNRFGQQRTEQLDLLLVAGRTEPTPHTGEGQQVFVLAMLAAQADEVALEIATVKELIHDFRDEGAQEAVASLLRIGVVFKEGVIMPGQALSERRCLGLAPPCRPV